MSTNSRSLTNSFLDVRLVSLASWSKASEIQPRDQGGPYVILQSGYDPQDLTMTPDEFVLGRSGKWTALGLFYRLPIPERREEYVFGTAGEAMRVLGGLPSKVAILRPGEKPEPAEPPAEPGTDEMAAAIEKGKAHSDTGG